MKHEPEPVPDGIARVQSEELIRELRAWANMGELVNHRVTMLRIAAEIVEKIRDDRDYWRSRTHALEAERRALLLEHGIDLGERPALDCERDQKESRCTCGDTFVAITGAHDAACPVVRISDRTGEQK